MTKMPAKSHYKKQLERIEKNEAVRKAKEESDADKLAEMKEWLELATKSMIEERKLLKGEQSPPSDGRLRAMARRFHKANTSEDSLETMYVPELIHIVDRLAPEDRQKFNQFLGEIQGTDG